MTLPRLLTPREVADILQVSDSLVRQRAHEWGGTRIGKHWRFHPAHIARLIDPCAPEESTPQNAPAEAANGAYDGATQTDDNAKPDAPTKKKPKQQRSKYASAFARDFPEHAHATRSSS